MKVLTLTGHGLSTCWEFPALCRHHIVCMSNPDGGPYTTIKFN